jgi:hypothetical protein
VEQDDDQCDGDGQNMMSKAPTWNRRKRKKKPMEMKAKVHYYSKLNRGGRFSLSEVGKGNCLRPKVMVNL